jgi:hypothetical protein
MKLELWELMMIRACKKNRYSTRTLRRIYGASRALYLEHTPIEYATRGLMDIITKYGLVKDMHDFIVNIDHKRTGFWYAACQNREQYAMSFKEAFLLECASLIAMTPVNKFPNYHPPARFRNRKEAEV